MRRLYNNPCKKISIHALREEGDLRLILGVSGQHISIHALREEGDREVHHRKAVEQDFYPRPPRGGRPARREPLKGAANISIHALREEGDRSSPETASTTSHFYPRPPRGGRPLPPSILLCTLLLFYPRPPRGGRQLIVKPQDLRSPFLSTPSARRATMEESRSGQA